MQHTRIVFAWIQNSANYQLIGSLKHCKRFLYGIGSKQHLWHLYFLFTVHVCVYMHVKYLNTCVLHCPYH